MDATEFQNDISLSSALEAYRHTSFSPEKRAANVIKEYAETLASDYASLSKAASVSGTQALLPDLFAKYREGYKNHFAQWLWARSRCISSMITGPSGFPVERARKANEREHKVCGTMIYYRTNALQTLRRKLHPELRPIAAGDADALERLADKLAKAEQEQLFMKTANAVLRREHKNGAEAQILALIDIGFQENAARKQVAPGFGNGQCFASYRLSNNNAEIRRIKQRIEILIRNKAKPIQEVICEDFKVQDDPPANRIRVLFEGKPERSVREQLKENGFRWAPTLEAWQAYRNSRSMDFVRGFIAAHRRSAPVAQ
jgi:hypothetical protein